MNTVIRIYRDKLKQIKFNINLFQIKHRKASFAISRHDSIFQKRNFRILSQNSITNGFTTKRYQVYMNKRTETDILKDEEYVPSITSIKRLRFEEKTFVKMNASDRAIKECLYQSLKRKAVS